LPVLAQLQKSGFAQSGLLIYSCPLYCNAVLSVEEIPMKITIQSLIALILTAFVSTAFAAEKVTVADVHAKRTALAGKEITITGKVIKVNNGIMRRNFIHVQDGTGSGQNSKVIFTSKQTANVGDEIAATGTVFLDIDFGMGYRYPTLVEQSTFAPAK